MCHTDQIRGMLQAHGRLGIDVATLTPTSNLYDAGLASHASVSLMLALEDHFGIEFPERMLRRQSFESLAAIGEAITELLRQQAA
jgi:acyl carrier protein